MSDVFDRFPEFLSSDIRQYRRSLNDGYTINKQLLVDRFSTLLTKETVENRTILDIGCSTGAAGAWCLYHGAAEYTGVELQTSFADHAVKNFHSAFRDKNWKIFNISLEDFLKKNNQQFDVVIASGILYHSMFYQDLLLKLADIATVAIVIESKNPPSYKSKCNVPLVEYYNGPAMVHESGGNLKIKTAYPNLEVISMILEEKNFLPDKKVTSELSKKNNLYRDFRYGAIFLKNKSSNKKYLATTEDAYKNFSQSRIAPWSNAIPDKWSFNSDVAKDFVNHAKKHIPDYEKTIELSVSICLKHLKKDSNIIDVGSATGYTLRKLEENGFYNLYGVENSDAMIDYSTALISKIIKSDKFPNLSNKFNAILCNWTLHFIKDKKTYINDMFKNLENNGFLILTDKTSLDNVVHNLYTDFKRSNGVSEIEIANKTASLKDVMFIDSVAWYFDTLTNAGFKNVNIINAAPCFTTFLAIK
jgi:tRNA (cmo5U34)-methyltransferase